MYDYVSLFTNSVHFLLEQVAFIIILSLLALELASYLFSNWSISSLKKSLKNVFTFKYPWDFVALSTWLLLAFLSIFYFDNTSPVSATYLAAGIAVFLLGWLIRYQPVILRRLSKFSRRIRPALRNYQNFWNKLEFYEIHTRLFGPWLEIIGIAIIARSFVFYPAFFIFPLILGASIIYRGRKLALINPNITPPTPRDLIPKLGHILLFILIPLSIAVIVGIVTREFAIFYADIETAKTILFTLSQIEGGLGILAITIIFVLTQLTASNYSIRISTILFRQRAFWIPLIILFASISYNLLVASRSPIMFPLDTEYFHSLIIDLSFVFGLATACGIAYFIFKAPRMSSPEAIITDSLKSFNKEWLDTIKRDWCRPKLQLKLHVRYDPFIVIERILSRAVDSGDSLTFISGLILIRDHLHNPNTIDPRKLPNYLIEIDAYLRHHFRSIVRTAAKNSDAYTLLQLIYFIEELGNPSPESVTKCDTVGFNFDEAPGELLLREIIEQSTAYRLTECVTRGIHIVESRGVKVIETLPKQTDTWFFNQMKSDSELSKEEQERLRANYRRVGNFGHQYFSYLGSLGVKAANSKSTEVVRSATLAINNIVSSVIQDIDGYIMKATIVRQAIWNLDEIMKASCNNNLSAGMSLSMLEYAAEHTDANQDEAVAWDLVRYVSEFLLSHAKLGLLGYMNVVDSAMFGLRIVEKYTDPAIHLLKSMGEAAKLLRQNESYTENKELQMVYNEIIQRIRQVGLVWPRKDPNEISSIAKSVLAALNEPEFKEKHKT